MSQSRKPRYRTTNWKQYNAALKARGSLTVWLDKRMCWFATASGKPARTPRFSDAAIQFCLTLKNLFGLALRQATGLVESVLQLSGLAWPTPDFSTLSRRQQTLNVQIPYTRSPAGLHLLVDSTGIKFLGEGEWKCKKHGAAYRRQWRKLHIGIDAQTMQIRAVCVTSNNISDAAVIADLLDQLPEGEKLESLTGDGAYDTKQVYEAVLGHGATPIIPPRKNARIRKGRAFAHRNAAIAACKRLGRRIWKAWSGYHRRSLVETKMNCIKRLGDRVMARGFSSQVNELHIRAAILNRFTELGRPQTAAVA
ncbi:IS5 family transposase [Pseudomonas aeruginosa]|nr:IS5 family transposase [Pseudomonas aeruginosa]EKW6758457.1 IS5 family transposase [Pseudomonas aeruginosa]EKY2868204.1 IS5 family transposase [Pseudomonas aeruginosa]ELI2562320.1 IS5 family transposase [Pseudomonas aeruginosa]